MFLCDECGEEKSNKGNLTHHISEVHGGSRPFTCDICDKGFKNKYDLAKHILTRHQHQRCFKCELCGSAFSCSTDLVRHKDNIHHGIKYGCDDCGKVYGGYKKDLTNHILVVHFGCHPFECVLCGAKFTQSLSLRRHTDSKHRTRFIQCDECDGRFARKDILISHITAVHQKLLRFTCDQCQAAFNLQNDLVKHKLRIHLPRVLACHDCSKMFATKGTLADHCMSVDVRNRCFKCPLCYKQFASRSGLWGHKKIHG